MLPVVWIPFVLAVVYLLCICMQAYMLGMALRIIYSGTRLAIECDLGLENDNGLRHQQTTSLPCGQNENFLKMN